MNVKFRYENISIVMKILQEWNGDRNGKKTQNYLNAECKRLLMQLMTFTKIYYGWILTGGFTE